MSRCPSQLGVIFDRCRTSAVFLRGILVARLTCWYDPVLSVSFVVDMSSNLCRIATIVYLAIFREVSACLSLPVALPVASILARSYHMRNLIVFPQSFSISLSIRHG